MPWIHDAAFATPREIYEAIEQEAQKVDLTMYALCKQSGVDAATVNRWNTGDSDPSFRIVRQLMSTIRYASGQIIPKPKRR